MVEILFVGNMNDSFEIAKEFFKGLRVKYHLASSIHDAYSLIGRINGAIISSGAPQYTIGSLSREEEKDFASLSAEDKREKALRELKISLRNCLVPFALVQSDYNKPQLRRAYNFVKERMGAPF